MKASSPPLVVAASESSARGDVARASLAAMGDRVTSEAAIARAKKARVPRRVGLRKGSDDTASVTGSILTPSTGPCESLRAMDRFESEYRRLVGAFADELVAVTREFVRAELEVAEAEAAARRAAAPQLSPRLQLALERAEERRRIAAERRAAALAARAARAARRAENAGPGGEGGRRNGAATPAAPPPLFVHKRSRDGSIQRLERAGGPAPATPSSATAQTESQGAENGHLPARGEGARLDSSRGENVRLESAPPPA